MCLASVFGSFATCKVVVGHRDIYFAKKSNIISDVWSLEFL